MAVSNVWPTVWVFITSKYLDIHDIGRASNPSLGSDGQVTSSPPALACVSKMMAGVRDKMRFCISFSLRICGKWGVWRRECVESLKTVLILSVGPS